MELSHSDPYGINDAHKVTRYMVQVCVCERRIQSLHLKKKNLFHYLKMPVRRLSEESVGLSRGWI